MSTLEASPVGDNVDTSACRVCLRLGVTIQISIVFFLRMVTELTSPIRGAISGFFINRSGIRESKWARGFFRNQSTSVTLVLIMCSWVRTLRWISQDSKEEVSLCPWVF